MTTPRVRRKLIEVALPLDAINAAAAREKSIRHGHPSTLHLWWARRPLAAARAVIFAQLVDDPSEYVDVLLSDPAKKRAAQRALKKRRLDDASTANEPARPRGGDPATPEPPRAAAGVRAPATAERQALAEVAAEIERERVFRLVEELVLWENTTNEEVLERARTEIWQSWRRACAENADHPRAKEIFDRHKLPAFHDPFAGGGALPLEAQRLGLEAHASDLNPVAVLINKAMIEIPPKFADRPPVNPESRAERTVVAKTWRGAQGLAEDVRYYGRWMRDEAEKRIGHLYPRMEITPELVRERPDADGHCVAVGTHGEEPQPGLRGCRRAARVDVHAVDQEGQGGVRRAGDRGTGLPVHGEGRRAAKRRRGQDRDEALAPGQFSLPDVRNTHHQWLHQVREHGPSHGHSADGCRGGGRVRPPVSFSVGRSRRHRSPSNATMET